MEPCYCEGGQTIYCGDVLEVLRQLPDASVQCCVTSPPYWGLRDYGIEPSVWGDATCAHEWGDEQTVNLRGGEESPGSESLTGGQREGRIKSRSAGQWCQFCGAWRGCLGNEPTPDLFVAHLVEVFREVRRVLREDGTLWLNIGDSYARDPGKGEKHRGKVREWMGPNPNRLAGPDIADGLKPKDLVGVPWMLAFALRADGWWLRSDIIWHKPNGMPSSVKDRPSLTHEYVFLLTKAERYYYDGEAVKEPNQNNGVWGRQVAHKMNDSGAQGKHGSGSAFRGLSADERQKYLTGGRSLRTVWTLNDSVVKLRDDLSEGDLSYVLGELARRGLLSSSPGSGAG